MFLTRIIVAKNGAIKTKYLKKMTFINIFKALGIFQGGGQIIWSFTSDIECTEATRYLGNKNIKNYIIAEDLPRAIDYEKQLNKIKSTDRTGDNLRIIFLSRICSKKILTIVLIY